MLDYAATYLSAQIRYHTSDMRLHVNSYASYLFLLNARSRGSRFFYLSDNPTNTKTIPTLKNNGSILTECKTLNCFVTSVSQAEFRILHHSGQHIIPIRRTLNETEHPQEPTPIKIESSISAGFFNKTIFQNKSKSWDMQWNWMKDKILSK